jgi:hypothetical protein
MPKARSLHNDKATVVTKSLSFSDAIQFAVPCNPRRNQSMNVVKVKMCCKAGKGSDGRMGPTLTYADHPHLSNLDASSRSITYNRET